MAQNPTRRGTGIDLAQHAIFRLTLRNMRARPLIWINRRPVWWPSLASLSREPGDRPCIVVRHWGSWLVWRYVPCAHPSGSPASTIGPTRGKRVPASGVVSIPLTRHAGLAVNNLPSTSPALSARGSHHSRLIGKATREG